MVYYLDERPRLGRPTSELLEKIQRQQKDDEGETESEQPDTIMCGLFERGSIVKAKIKTKTIDCFKFYQHLIGTKEQEIIRNVWKIKSSNGDLKYAARPYNINIGQILLFHDVGNAFRCRIDDIYTVLNEDGRLSTFVDVYLIDRCCRLTAKPIEQIFEFPNIISDLSNTQPESHLCRLAINFNTNDQDVINEINRYYNWLIEVGLKSVPDGLYDVKILDYQNDQYYVDIYNTMNYSIIQHLKNKFTGRLNDLKTCPMDSSLISDYSHLLTIPRLAGFQLSPRRLTGSKNLNRHRLNGVVQYFRNAQSQVPRDGAYLARRLFKVRLIHWPNPKTIHVVPDDQTYVDSFASYSQKLCNYQENMDKLMPPDETRIYVEGENCLFRNNEVAGLGEWLRGKVIRVPHINQASVLHHIEKCIGERDSDMPPIIKKENLLYGIKSIDYGFFCTRTSINMRPVRDKNLFLARGPWSLQCNLFGVEPFAHDIDIITGKPNYSLACGQMLDAWVRERLKNNLANKFHIIFRSNIMSFTDAKSLSGFKPDVSLFHRYEPPYTLQDCITPRRRKFRFDCLNWYLVCRGFASTGKGNLSEVGLDEWILNMLVAHDKL